MATPPSDTTRPAGPLPPRRRHRRRGRWGGPLILFAACAMLVDGLAGDRGLAGVRRARTEYRQLSEEVARAIEENAGLREQARRLHDDPAMIEQVARQDLGLIRPGEILVVLERRP